MSVAGILLIRHVLYSPFGYAMRACRDSVLRSQSIGINVQRQLWLAFAFSGAMAGLADDAEIEDEDEVAPGELNPERYAEMSAAENLILTITSGGAGKLSSSHDYPVRGRGGMGVQAMDKAMRGGDIVASFPVELDDQIMLATSKGQSIRVPVEGISFRSRSAGGVKVFDTGKNEVVVSVAWIADQGDEDDAEASGAETE